MAHQLSIPQRITISLQLDEGKSYAEIGRMIGVHRSTVKREIDRNSIEGVYCPKIAHSMALGRKKENGKACRPPLTAKMILTGTTSHQRMLPNYITFRRRLALYYRERFAELIRIRGPRKRFYYYTEHFISRSLRYKQWKLEYDRARERFDYRPLTFLQKIWRKYPHIFNSAGHNWQETPGDCEHSSKFRIEKRKLEPITGTGCGKPFQRYRPSIPFPSKAEKKKHSGKYYLVGNIKHMPAGLQKCSLMRIHIPCFDNTS